MLVSSVKKIVQSGGKFIAKNLENSLVRYMTRLLDHVKKVREHVFRGTLASLLLTHPHTRTHTLA
jgi:hypothetical protein